jgi:heme oxygenase
MAETLSSFAIHIRSGFFRLDPYEMILSADGIHLCQTIENKSVERIHLENLEVQKIVLYSEVRSELEIITSREVFSAVLSKKTDTLTILESLRFYFGGRVVIY